MTEEYRELFNEINELKTKLAVVDYFISSFKEQDNKTGSTVESIKQRLTELENKVYNSLKDIEYNIENKVSKMESKIEEVHSDLKSNSFLEFTSAMDAKKWGILIAIVTTVLGTVGSIDSVVGSNRGNGALLEQIESLVELADD